MPQDIFIETLFGISTDEPLRAKERGPRWQRTRYPLIELGMSRDDCIAWLKRRSYPVPFKSACIQCPYRSDESWLWMGQTFPDEFEEACRYDDAGEEHSRAENAGSQTLWRIQPHPRGIVSSPNVSALARGGFRQPGCQSDCDYQ